MRELSATSEKCFLAIKKELLAGRQNGWNAWRAENFPETTERTLWRLIAKARAALPSVPSRDVKNAVAAVNELQRMTATDATVAAPPAALRSRDAEGPIAVLAVLRGAIADAAAVREWSLGPARPDGTRPIRNAQFFAKAAEISADLVNTMLRVSERAWEMQRTKQLFDLIIDEIGKESPDLRDRILKRFHAIGAERGITFGAAE